MLLNKIYSEEEEVFGDPNFTCWGGKMKNDFLLANLSMLFQGCSKQRNRAKPAQEGQRLQKTAKNPLSKCMELAGVLDRGTRWKNPTVGQKVCNKGVVMTPRDCFNDEVNNQFNRVRLLN